ncbi:unnamed protein product [Chondrus crispus]|uniref:Uncharacterized protein n=1 Tax=Chondrus crispus TaxID=2769 RepID=R7QR44_CHOCR|nr:unnamed protein product [Chondrus crispus]CDF40952.1 unnamed protein product [Chondrus crispus]|eukprot:XP_005711246.1 unnamed protein product [Chondrus crispus]
MAQAGTRVNGRDRGSVGFQGWGVVCARTS